MIRNAPIAPRFAAAISAFALTVLLFGGTVVTPTQAHAPVAYVGAVA